MDIKEKKEKLDAMQKYFAISFWISFFLLLLSTVLCIYMHNEQLAFVMKYFPLDDVKDYNELVVLLLGFWKILIIQFTLIPALAIWCIRKCCKCNKCDNSNEG